MPHPTSLAIIPPTRLLVAGRQDSTQRIYARRSTGTADWLLIYTEKGQAYFRFKGGEFIAKSDDLVLIKPGTPHDYGLEEKHGHWKNTWVHFNPRPDCLAWLKWPEITKGFMQSTIGGNARRGEEMAANALERVLLLCDSVNPLHHGNNVDPRIRKAVELLSLTYHNSFTLDGLARECGLSRSRLAELFRKETGSAPMTFLETRRMRRVQELLKYTSFSLAEIAEQTGFSSPFYLSLRFKKTMGSVLGPIAKKISRPDLKSRQKRLQVDQQIRTGSGPWEKTVNFSLATVFRQRFQSPQHRQGDRTIKRGVPSQTKIQHLGRPSRLAHAKAEPCRPQA